jgi:hypothetical protein
MSYSTLYAIYRTTATDLREYRNSWGTGPLIWDFLCQRYLDMPGWSLTNDARLWKLAVDPSVPAGLRACHVLTFDYALVSREMLPDMAALVAEGAALFADFAADRANHFPAIAADLASIKLSKKAIGAGLNCTSVADTWGQQGRHWGKPFDCFAYINSGKDKQP